MILLPFILLGLLEGVLRVSGFGASYPLFIEATTPQGYLRPNPDLIKRYFTAPEYAPAISPDTVYFKSAKPEQTIRVVVQGGSSAAGFPYGRFGSLAGMLQQRFKRQYPDKHIEVINTAMSAVNSYTMLDLVEEIIEVEPNLVLIYAGHNEYLGVMGVGSTFAARGGRDATLLFLSIKELRLYQLMQRIYQLLISKPESAEVTDRTLMAEVAAGQKILFDSELYHQGLVQFSENLDLILESYREQKIPVIVGTLASNEKDQKPFASSIGDYSAESLFTRANELLQQRQFDQAREQFRLARDRDLLRFRAPSAMNQIIREKAVTGEVYIADSEQLIRDDTENGIIGYEHMLEHLHPNSRGYFLLAEAYAQIINDNQLLGGTARDVAIDKAWIDIPLTAVDDLVAEEKIVQLTSDYPFSEQQRPTMSFKRTSEERKIANARVAGADWLVSMNELLQLYQRQNRVKEAAKVAGIMYDAIPEQHRIAYIAGQLYYRSGDTAMALFYHRQAVALQSENVNYLLMAARSHYANQQLGSSVELLEKAVQLDPTNQQAKTQLIRIKAEMERES